MILAERDGDPSKPQATLRIDDKGDHVGSVVVVVAVVAGSVRSRFFLSPLARRGAQTLRIGDESFKLATQAETLRKVYVQTGDAKFEAQGSKRSAEKCTPKV